MKRVVTDGRGDASRIADAGAPATVVRFGPGFEVHEIWRLDAPPTDPTAGYDPPDYSFDPGHSVFRMVVIPPDEAVLSSLEQGEKWGKNSPYRSTGDRFGLHSTQTLDFVTVVSGEVDLRMPDGSSERLRAGDVVVQQGAAHAWRNPGPDQLVLAVVMLGTGAPQGREES